MPGIAILVPEVVPLLLVYTPQAIPFFVQTPAVDILRDRMLIRGDAPSDINIRLHHVGEWETTARGSTVPYVFISNNGTIESAVDQVCKQLRRD